MERFCRVLKPGGKSAPWRVQTAQRFLKALALDVIVAWRIHNITMAGRADPEVSCAVVFEPQAWATLSTMQQHCPPPPTPPPRREMVRSLAQLGGFFARQGDGEPGLNAIWQGDQRRHEFIYAIATYRTVNGFERNV
jgi:Transposase Tn5 dimerisation domain